MAPVQAGLDQARWRLNHLTTDLADLMAVAEPSLAAYPDAPQRGLWTAIVDVADPHHFARRHGRWGSHLVAQHFAHRVAGQDVDEQDFAGTLEVGQALPAPRDEGGGLGGVAGRPDDRGDDDLTPFG